MATIIAPFTPVDGNGNVRANARLYYYMTGTTTPQNTFTDAALSVTATNPVVADSNGLFSAMYLGDLPDFMAYKAILKTSADVTVWTADPIAGAPITAPLSAALLRGYLAGLQRTASTNTTISYGAGVCADSTNASMLSLSAGTINCATVGADGLDAGALANSTWYHAFAIGKTDGTTARLASTSPLSPTMPSGYTYKRRIGSFKTGPSTAPILAHVQYGDKFFWVAPLTGDINATNPGIATVSRTLTVPTGVSVEAIVVANIYNSSSTYYLNLFLSDLATNDVAASDNFSIGQAAVSGAGGVVTGGQQVTIRTNTSAQIRSRVRSSTGATDASSALTINTLGWIDRRGQDD